MSILATVNTIYDSALALVYPQACEVCGLSVEKRADGVTCGSCWQETRTFGPDDLICWKCGTPAPGSVPHDKRQEVRCRRCDAEPFTAARACGAYEGALRASVLSLKSKPYVPTRLANLVFETQQLEPLRSVSRIMPVPLHADRLRERGFNQAAILGQALARLSRLRLDDSSLVRTAHTERHRAGMDARGRRESVEKAFEVRYPRRVQGERILLIDDVFTSGATVSACAKVLMAAGAQAAFVLTIARTIDSRRA